MLRNMPRRPSNAVLVGLWLLLGCGADSGAPAGKARPPSDVPLPSVHFDVTWKPDTLQIMRGGADYARYQLDDAQSVVQVAEADVAAYHEGQHVLIEDRGLFKVLGVEGAGANVMLHVEPGALVEAAERGEIEWDAPLAADSPQAYFTETELVSEAKGRDPEGALLPESDPGTETDEDQEPQPLPALKDVGGDFSGTINGVELKGSLKARGEAIDLSLSAKVSGGSAYTRAGIKGTVTGLRHIGRFVFDEGQVKQLEYGIDDMEAVVDFDVEGAGASQDYAIDLPWKVTWPLAYGPIPGFISLTLGLEVRSTTKSSDSAKAIAHMRWRGGSGFKVEGTEVMRTGKLVEAAGETESAVHESVFSSGLGILISLPKIELGVGVPTYKAGKVKLGANVAMFCSFDVEEVTNVEVEVNLVTAAKRWCRDTELTWGAFAGSSLKLFSWGFNTKFPLTDVQENRQREGPHCD